MRSDYLAIIATAVAALTARKEEINRLNVFPVPDGDTGTNMSLTLEAVVSEVGKLPPDAPLADVRRAITHGSLMGGRGNSGVITSQILRGICEGLEGAEKFDAPTIATALEGAVDRAFHAVHKPVEGTILTVIHDAAAAARTAADNDLARDEALHYISQEAFASVARTPELLPILKENGVVDAGGFGLALLIEGFVGAVTGDISVIPAAASLGQGVPQVAIEQVDDWEGSAFLYCTEFLLHGEGVDEDATRAFLTTMGDCELLVGASPLFKVHVHTNEPGTVLAYMTAQGEVSEVHIHNMKLQSAERGEKLAASAAPTPPKALGYVAVCMGTGTAKILGSQGIDYIVSGGQTMNPSTRDFLDAINAVNAQSVIVFPNNSNVIMSATQAAELSDKPVGVIPTKSVPQSFSAMVVADPEASLEENVAAMTSAVAAVRFGEVTVAVKKAKTANGATIHKNDVIGLADGAIDVVGKNVNAVALDLISVIAADADMLTILAGRDLPQSDFEALLTAIGERFPDLEVDPHRGEQPLYPLVMGAE